MRINESMLKALARATETVIPPEDTKLAVMIIAVDLEVQMMSMVSNLPHSIKKAVLQSGLERLEAEAGQDTDIYSVDA